MNTYTERNMEGYELFKKSVSNMPMIFYVLDRNWTFQLSDGKGLGKLGLEPGQVVGVNAREMYRDHPDIIEAIEKAFQGESVFAVHALGEAWLENYVVPYYGSSGEVEGIVGATIDITERRRVEDELEKSRRLQKALVDSVPGMLYMYDSEGRLVFWNEAHKTLTGYSDEELLHKGLMDWYENDPSSRKAVAEGLENMAVTGFGQAEANLQTKEKKAIPMYFTACPLTIDDMHFFVGIGVDISSRKKAEAELLELNRTLEEKVGQRTLELKRSNEELVQANEELYAMNEEIQAINEELADTNGKLRKMQDCLVESEKMAALGNLVAGVAHEVNTPIGVSVTAASHLSDMVRELMEIRKTRDWNPEDLEPLLEDIDNASRIILRNLNHAGHLIQSFKQLSVDQSLEPQRVFDMGKYLEEILLSLSPSFKRTNITIHSHCPEKISFNGWPGAFAQIISNLLLNSLQHGFLPGEKGRIDLELIWFGDKVRLTCRDDGHGMPKETLDRIYEPFFTTKRSSGGTGLGLSIVYALVTQKYHGTIRCESAPERGTRFIIELLQGGDSND